jgi:hypothetical protein
MKVFLTWSGEKSRRVAEILREWLPNVIQALEPWLSSEDIEKGSQWGADITSRLKESKAGIICVTETNISAPWLNFEAGAISNSIVRPLVCTFLMGPKSSDLTGPLTLFQATLPTREDLRRLLGTLNKALEGDALQEKKLDAAFEVWWTKLEGEFQSIRSVASPVKQTRSERDIMEETLNIVREVQKHLSAAAAFPQQASIIGSFLSPGMVSVSPDSSYGTWIPATVHGSLAGPHVTPSDASFKFADLIASGPPQKPIAMEAKEAEKKSTKPKLNP